MELSYFKRNHGKGNFIFPLHPVPFFGQDYEKQKMPGICLFESQNMFTKIHFLVRPFDSGNWKEKGKKKKTSNISRMKSTC